MKIAVTSAGSTLGSAVEPRLGRCPYFLMVDTADLNTTAVANRHRSAGGGAGTACAQLIADEKVDVLLTGQCGPNAHAVLTAAGIEVVTNQSGTIAEVINRYLAACRGAA